MLRPAPKVKVDLWMFLRYTKCAICSKDVEVWFTRSGSGAQSIIHFHNGFLWLRPNEMVRHCTIVSKAQEVMRNDR